MSPELIYQTINKITDLGFVHKLHSLEETDRFNTLGIPRDEMESMALLESWINKNNSIEETNYTLIILLKKSQKPIGLFGLQLGKVKYKRSEVWFKLHKQFWNQGYASEVLYAMLDFGFNTLNLHRIEAGCAVENIGSIRVLEKCGFTKEGRGRKVLPLKSGWSDNFEYAILETEFNSRINNRQK
jgi:RimJ/RimL family protein N-acetyltransferase